MAIVRTRHITRKRKKRSWVLLISLFLIAICIALVYSIVQYFKQTNYSSIVDTAITKTIGAEYAGNRPLTRQETVCIVLDLLYGLGQKDFENIQGTDIISYAVQIGMLKGDSDSLRLENHATKQESLVFIARGLDILSNSNSDQESPLSSNTQLDDWARPEIEGLIIQNCLTPSDIDVLRNLRENITASELKFVLDKIATYKNRHRTLFGYLSFCLEVYPLITAIGAISTIVTIGIPLKDFFKRQKKKQRRRGTICLAGTMSVGKSTLMKKMIDCGTPIYNLKNDAQPTRARHAQEIMLLSRNNEILLFEGTIIDVPGSNPADVLQFMAGPDRNKILLLILAHTKANRGTDEIDQDFVNEQLVDVQRTWVPAIKAHAMDLNKAVIFVNKLDLLSTEYLPAQECIYEEHIKHLCEAARVAGVHINVIEGSSTSGTNLYDLYTRLKPLDGKGGAYVEE